MLTVRIIFIDTTKDDEIKDVPSLDDVCLDGVKEIKPIRDDRASARYKAA